MNEDTRGPMPRYGRHVSDPLSPEAFYESARDFAQRALQAHHAGEFRRVALEAGTALEHLAKACSPSGRQRFSLS